MTIRYPDNPVLVSVDFLKKLDADPRGTWIAQPKLDGRRRIAWKEHGHWYYRAKNKDDAQPLKPELLAELESLAVINGTCFDMELVGPRHKDQPHSLHIFDVLMVSGVWCGDMPFERRIEMLAALEDDIAPLPDNIRFMPHFTNPGLVELYERQKLNPLSEGIVVRHKDSLVIGNFARCVDNPKMFKVRHR